MAIRKHPPAGTILTCNFDTGFTPPEMVKRRTVIVVSPPIRARPGLCTVVCCSTTAPNPVQPYHCLINLSPPMPRPWKSDGVWVKGDMIYAVSFDRLDLIRLGKDQIGKRLYRYDLISREQMRQVQACILAGIGLINLTKHLD